MSLTAARPAGGDKPRPYILRVSGARKYVVGAAFMAARGPGGSWHGAPTRGWAGRGGHRRLRKADGVHKPL